MRFRATVMVLSAVVALAVLVKPAGAAAPQQQGWWTASPVLGPDVPDDGLLIEGASASPTSFSALVYHVGHDAALGTLKLAVSPGTATVPNVTLRLCLLEERVIEPAQGGAIADAPAFDCATNVSGGPGSNGTTYEFDVESLVRDDVLAVAIVATTPADRVVLAAPDGDSLAVERAAAPEPAVDAGAGSGIATTPVMAESVLSSLPPLPDAHPPTAGPAEESRAGDASRRVSLAASVPSSVADETSETSKLLLVLFGVAVLLGIWLAIGRSAAMRARNGVIP